MIPKSATIYYYSSTVACGICRAHKLGKQNRKWLDSTTDNSLEPSVPSYSYKKLNKNTDITSKKLLTAETRSIRNFALDDKPAVIIQN